MQYGALKMSGLGQWLTGFVDAMVPDVIGPDDHDRLRRARMLVLMCACFCLVNSAYLVWAVFVGLYDEPLFLALLLADVLFIAAPVILRRTASLVRSGWMLMLGMVGLLGIGTFYSGGFQSAWLPWSVIVPLIATFLVGPVLGAVCAGLLAVNALVLYWFEVLGVSIPAETPALTEHSLTMTSVVVSLAVVATLGWLFEAERLRALRSLERSERRFRRLADQSADAVLVHDAAGHILDANKRACATLGYSLQELLALNLGNIDAGPHRPERFHNLGGGRQIALESSYRRKDGNTYPVDVRVSAFDAEGSPLFISSARDVTAKRYAEQALRDAKEDAERANKAKTRFLANMSHEMRTPLNSIIGFARVLERGTFGELNQQQTSFARNILDAGEHMLGLVNDLLDYRRLEEGRVTLELQPLAIRQVIDEALTLVRSEVEQRSHSLEIVVPEDVPPALGDRHATVRVLTNLLSNAARYTEDGGYIEVRVAATGQWLTISVVDNGIGVAKEDQERIFQYFEQVNSKLARKSRGSGLGLALTRALVRRLGGEIGIESTPGVGSTFWFTMPRYETGAAMASPR